MTHFISQLLTAIREATAWWRNQFDSMAKVNMICNVKTIAITIDGPTLRRLDRLVTSKDERRKNRSQIIRLAVQEYVARLERQSDEQEEREILRRHRKRLEKQAAELVKEQAKL